MDNGTSSHSKLNISRGELLRKIIEGRPVFANQTEQILLTLYVFLILILTYVMHGIFISMVAYYRKFHTPYFVILMHQSIYELIPCATVCVSIIYMSLSGSNPYRGNTWTCTVHRMLAYSPVYAHTHNLCVLSVDRVLFFYRPFWYQRVMSVRVVVAVEAVVFLFGLCFNSAVNALGPSIFSPTYLLCFVIKKKWISIFENTLYYGVTVLVIFSAIVMLQRLIVKQRRAIASQMALDGGRNREEIRSVSQGIQEDQTDRTREVGIALASNSGEAELANPGISGNNYQSVQIKEINIASIKKGLRVIGSMSGVFWLGFFPSLTALLILQKMNYKTIQNDNIAKDIIIRRLFRFYPQMSLIINPFIYIYANPAMRKGVARLFGKIRGREISHL